MHLDMATPRVMTGGLAKRIPFAALDPRYGQVAAQATFLILELFWLDFGPPLAEMAVLIGGGLARRQLS